MVKEISIIGNIYKTSYLLCTEHCSLLDDVICYRATESPAGVSLNIV